MKQDKAMEHLFKIGALLLFFIYFIDQGYILEEGPPEEIFTAPTSDRCKEFLDKVINAN